MEIQDRIKKRREELGLSMRDVASALGVASSTVSRYENSNIENMGIDKIEMLSRVLRCSPAYLMGWEALPNPLSGSSLSYDETNLIIVYRSLNTEGKKRLSERAEELRDLGYVKGDVEKMA